MCSTCELVPADEDRTDQRDAAVHRVTRLGRPTRRPTSRSRRTEGVHFERAWLDPEAGKVFCLATGPSKEAVMRIHERAGHPTGEVYELPIEV